MNLYKEMTEDQADIVKGLCRNGALDMAKEFIDFYIELLESKNIAIREVNLCQ